jgi:hypothetical protein
MSDSTFPSSSVIFTEDFIKELKSQQDKGILHVSSLEAAINETNKYLQQLKKKYSASKNYLCHLGKLIVAASAFSTNAPMKVPSMPDASSTVASAKKLPDDLEVPRVEQDDSKLDAPTIIREVLEMHFSDKVHLNTFTLMVVDNSDEPVLCAVYLKGVPPSPFEIWYNATKDLVDGGRMVCYAGKHHSYTTVGDLKVAIESILKSIES